MQITEVTASWTETANLGNYSNVRPSLSLKATLEPGDDPVFAQLELMRECKEFVQEQVDQALEAEGQPAKYSTEPRFDVIVECWGHRTAILIVPGGTRPKIDGRKTYPAVTKFRLEAAQAYALNRAKSIDIGDEIVAIYDTSVDAKALEYAMADIIEAKTIYDAAQAEAKRKQEEEWAEQRRLREEAYARQQAERLSPSAVLLDRDPDDDEDEDDEA